MDLLQQHGDGAQGIRVLAQPGPGQHAGKIVQPAGELLGLFKGQGHDLGMGQHREVAVLRRDGGGAEAGAAAQGGIGGEDAGPRLLQRAGDDQGMAEVALVGRARAPGQQGLEVGRFGQADIVFLPLLQVRGDADVHDADAAAVGVAVGIQVGPLQGVQGGGDPGADVDAGVGGEALAQARGDVHGGDGDARAVDGVERLGEQAGGHRLVQAGAEHGIDQEGLARVAGGQGFLQEDGGGDRLGDGARFQQAVVIGLGVGAELAGPGQEQDARVVAALQQQAGDGQAVAAVVALAGQHQAGGIAVARERLGKIVAAGGGGVLHQDDAGDAPAGDGRLVDLPHPGVEQDLHHSPVFFFAFFSFLPPFLAGSAVSFLTIWSSWLAKRPLNAPSSL